MRTKLVFILVGGLVAALTFGILSGRDNPALGQKKTTTEQGKERQADEEAIRKSSRAFAAAFEKGDAKAIAALWTEQGEIHEASGELIRGRAAIEKAFAEFFKEQPKRKIEVLIEAIRFPAAYLAVEEGVLRMGGAGKELPSTTLYSVTHVREGGQWKIAVSREWGAGQDRLEDLYWLVGKWTAALKDQEVTLSFSRAENKPFLVGQFTKRALGKVVYSGTIRIGLDPQRGQLRSWHFDDDGGHGQALWIRDGNRWVLDSIGVLGDGTETASVDILGRISNDAFTWRSIDRVLGDQDLPDTVPIRLNRVRAGK
jgi:uncharacterized protein (TIGR02246 family)